MASPCVQAVLDSVGQGTITQAEANTILQNARQMALNRARLKNINVTQALRQVAGELSRYHATEYARLKRQMLLNARSNRDAVGLIANAKETPGKAMNDFMLGSESVKGEGFGPGTFGRIAAATGQWVSRFINDLRAADVFEQARNSEHGLDVMRELEGHTNPTVRPGVSGNPVAKAIAEVIFNVSEKLRRTVNEFGGFIEFRAGYTVAQTWDVLKMRALGREGGILGWFKPADKAKAFAEWKAFELPLWDVDKMTEGGVKDIDDVAKAIFDNFWDDKHSWEIEGELDESFRAFGSVAKKFSHSRVVHFKDAASAFAHEQRFGRHGGDYWASIVAMLESRAKMLVLLQDWGPGGKANMKKRVNMLEQIVDAMPDGPERDKALASIKSETHLSHFERMYDTMSGLVDIPVSQTVSRGFQAAKLVALMGKGGAMLLNSLGDFPITRNQMTFAGVRRMDQMGARLQRYFRSKEISAEGLHQLGIGSSVYMLETVRSGGRDLGMSDAMRKLSQKYYDAIGMTRHTESMRMMAADALTTNLGRQSDKVFSALDPDTQRILAQHDILPPEWDVMRQAVHTFTEGPMEGHKALSQEMFDTIPDAAIDGLLRGKGQTVTTANRNRLRSQLEIKYGALITDRVAAVASEPGGWERWIATGGGRAQAGTFGGELYRSLFMFKMFPLAITRRLAAQGRHLGTGRGVFNGIYTLAGLTVAGYLSMATRNLLLGKEIPKWIDENGEFNHKTLLASWEKGGGFGLYGSLIFGEYDRFGRGLVDSLTGPMVGSALDLIKTGKQMVPDDEDEAPGRMGLAWWKQLEGNLPMANVFYIKPALDHALFWTIREMISPGTLHKRERAAEQHGDEWYIRPSEVAPLDLEDRMGELFKRPKKAVESVFD